MAHFGRRFAVFWPVIIFLKHSEKVCCIFQGGGGGVKAFLWTACCCQKLTVWHTLKFKLIFLKCQLFMAISLSCISHGITAHLIIKIIKSVKKKDFVFLFVPYLSKRKCVKFSSSPWLGFASFVWFIAIHMVSLQIHGFFDSSMLS